MINRECFTIFTIRRVPASFLFFIFWRGEDIFDCVCNESLEISRMLLREATNYSSVSTSFPTFLCYI